MVDSLAFSSPLELKHNFSAQPHALLAGLNKHARDLISRKGSGRCDFTVILHNQKITFSRSLLYIFPAMEVLKK